MSDHDGAGAMRGNLAVQGMLGSAAGSAPVQGDPWRKLPPLLAAMAGPAAAGVRMTRAERRGG